MLSFKTWLFVYLLNMEKNPPISMRLKIKIKKATLSFCKRRVGRGPKVIVKECQV
jgi:hypothetical protein